MNETLMEKDVELIFNIGRTAALMEIGLEPAEIAEIAEKLKKPESIVRRWTYFVRRIEKRDRYRTE